MNFHSHLSKCIFNFGHVYSFWCFGFERFNGILGSYHVNNHQLEIQVMRRFLENQQVQVIDWPNEIVSFKKILQPGSVKGSIATVARVSGTEFRQAVQQIHGTGTNLRHLNFWNFTFPLPLGRQ